MKFFDYKDLGNHLLQLCPKVVKHPVYIYIYIYIYSVRTSYRRWFASIRKKALVIFSTEITLVVVCCKNFTEHTRKSARAHTHTHTHTHKHIHTLRGQNAEILVLNKKQEALKHTEVSLEEAMEPSEDKQQKE